MAAHLVKLACELPDRADRSLSLWTCAELARTVRRDGIVDSIYLEERLQAFIKEWNAEAAPFHWTRRSFDKVLAEADAAIQEAA